MQDGYSIGRRRDFIMPTLPQTSAQQYLIRARAEARWNHRRAGVPFGPTLQVNKFTPDDQTAWALEEARRSEANVPPTELPNEPLWSTGSVLYEAREFVAMLGRNGNTVEDLRACIGISAAELQELNQWADTEPQEQMQCDACQHGVPSQTAIIIIRFEQESMELGALDLDFVSIKY